MKTLSFAVRIEDLPDSSKDYRVQASVCCAITRELRPLYGDQVDVVVIDGPKNISVAELASGKEGA